MMYHRLLMSMLIIMVRHLNCVHTSADYVIGVISSVDASYCSVSSYDIVAIQMLILGRSHLCLH